MFKEITAITVAANLADLEHDSFMVLAGCLQYFCTKLFSRTFRPITFLLHALATLSNNSPECFLGLALRLSIRGDEDNVWPFKPFTTVQDIVDKWLKNLSF